jgi:hypothetical protein
VALAMGLDVQVRLGAEAGLTDLRHRLTACHGVAYGDAARNRACKHVDILDEERRPAPALLSGCVLDLRRRVSIRRPLS